MEGKPFLGNSYRGLCIYPGGKQFRRNRSVSQCFQDKHVFVFYAEIQNGREKWEENLER